MNEDAQPPKRGRGRPRLTPEQLQDGKKRRKNYPRRTAYEPFAQMKTRIRSAIAEARMERQAREARRFERQAPAVETENQESS